jgi:hypothetical protein
MSELVCTVFVVAVMSFMMWGAMSHNRRVNAAAATKAPISTPPPQPACAPAKRPIDLVPSAEAQKLGRERAKDLVVNSLNRTYDRIDLQFRQKQVQDVLNMESRRILMEGQMEREYQKALMESAMAPMATAPAPLTIEEEPEEMHQIEPVQVQHVAVPQMVMPQEVINPAAVRPQRFYNPDGLSNTSTAAEWWSVEQEEGRPQGPLWRNPESLRGRIQDWQGVVEQGDPPSQVSATPSAPSHFSDQRPVFF